jgi:mycothiol synthase
MSEAAGSPRAPLERDPGGWALRLDPPPDASLIGRVVGEVATAGGGRLTVWVTEPTPATDAMAAEAGLSLGRDLLQLRRSLPAGEGPRLDTRPFVPGQDEQAWLEVNNRAFATHPEQGGWDLSVITAREKEPWFDPDGFLLHEVDGRLAAFCWTKIHSPEGLGEIYVIGVDPSFHGRGLGRAITLTALDYLSAKGITIGMLYVDADNAAARALYDRLGFTRHHTDRSYVRVVSPRA